MDTRTCKFCGVEFKDVKNDEGTFDEGYCCKFHRKDHEVQLIREGKIKPIETGGNFAVMKDTKYKDAQGETIWFPKDEKPYFDTALRRTFNTKAEKAAYMHKNKLVMDGSSQSKYPIESGDVRDRSYRKRMRLED